MIRRYICNDQRIGITASNKIAAETVWVKPNRTGSVRRVSVNSAVKVGQTKKTGSKRSQSDVWLRSVHKVEKKVEFWKVEMIGPSLVIFQIANSGGLVMQEKEVAVGSGHVGYGITKMPLRAARKEQGIVWLEHVIGETRSRNLLGSALKLPTG